MHGWSGMSVQDAFDLLGADPSDLWTTYLALGGSMSSPDFETVLRDAAVYIGPREHNVIAQTLNEAFLDQGMDQYPVRSIDWTSDPDVGIEAASVTGRVSQLQIDSSRCHDIAAELLGRAGKAQWAENARGRAQLAKQRAARAKKTDPRI
jgi:hypothetical protein